MTVAVIEVPSALGLSADGVEGAPDAFREAGLHSRLPAQEVVRIDVPPRDDIRDSATGILNAQAIVLLALRLAEAVEAMLNDGALPLVLGGDCSLLLGPMLALRRRGRYGLAFIDGHADFQHPADEPTGEAASLDLALLTGRGPAVVADIEGRGPLVRDDDVAVVGYRAFGDNDRFLREHVRNTAITIADLDRVRRFGVERALEPVRRCFTQPGVEGFWVHFDVDALDDKLMPAVDHHHVGGLSWDEAEAIVSTLVSIGGLVGLDVTIFNPQLDHDGGLARQLTNLIARSLQARR